VTTAMDRTLVAARALVGLRIFIAGHAADMRSFGFRSETQDVDTGDGEWFLHIQCAWRIEHEQKTVTGSCDWNEPSESDHDPGPEWDPARGGSLQEKRLRELFRDSNDSQRTIANKTPLLVVQDVSADVYGGLILILSGNYRLVVFPAGSRGEFWRLFRSDDLQSHYVFELEEHTSPG